MAVVLHPSAPRHPSLLCRHLRDDPVNGLWTEMSGCGSGVHQTHVRKLDRRPSGYADLECGSTLRFKGRRASIPRRGGCARDHDARAGRGGAVGGANGDVVADRGVRHADVVSVGAASCGVCRVHLSGIAYSEVRRLHRQVRRKIGGAGSL